MSTGRLSPVPQLPEEDVSADTTPVQLALPGTHLVPVSPPLEERHPLTTTSAPEPQGTAAQQAAAFFETFQDERSKAFRGVPREDMPAGWADWHAKALSKVGGDEGRLLAACRGYLQSDWGRSRQPVCTALAFCSPKVWVRYIPPQQPAPGEASGPPSVDVPTETGRLWKECLTRLHDQGKHYALSWLTRARPVDVEDGHLMLAVPDLYFRQWVEEHYGQMVELLVRDFGLTGVRWLLPSQAVGAEQ